MATLQPCSNDEPLSKKPRLAPSAHTPPISMDEESELAFLKDLEEEEQAAMDLSPSDISPSDISPSLTPSSSQTPRDKWRRPPPPNINPVVDPLIFQQIDIDHYIGEVVEGMPGAQKGPVPILRMFGVTSDGNSVCAHLHGFLPYFFVPAPHDFHSEHCTPFRQELNKALIDDPRSNRDNVQEAVLAVDICQKSSMYGFYFNEKSDFLKITLALPKLVAPARRLINTISVPPFGQILYQV